MSLNVSSSHQTLDNFYPGEENLEAYRMLQSYIDNPAEDVLFLLGPPSCGKSHLLRGAVNKFCSSLELKVTLLTSESLKNRLVVAIQDNTIAEFWDDLLDVDVVIVDDCQFISYGVDSVIVELSEIYQRKNKRLVLAGDYLLNDLRVIPNLRVLELVRPSVDTRRIIVQEIAKENALALNEKLINLIAENTDDPRRIRGIISWLHAHQNEGGCSMGDESNIIQTLKEEIASQYEKLTHKGNRKSFYIIARALVNLGSERSKARVGGGWICGNHANAVRTRVQARLEAVYTEDDLSGLISHCVSGEAGERYEAILSNLIKEIPSVYVNGT